MSALHQPRSNRARPPHFASHRPAKVRALVIEWGRRRSARVAVAAGVAAAIAAATACAEDAGGIPRTASSSFAPTSTNATARAPARSLPPSPLSRSRRRRNSAPREFAGTNAATTARPPDLVGRSFGRPYRFRARIQPFQRVAAPFAGQCNSLRVRQVWDARGRRPGRSRNILRRRAGSSPIALGNRNGRQRNQKGRPGESKSVHESIL